MMEILQTTRRPEYNFGVTAAAVQRAITSNIVLPLSPEIFSRMDRAYRYDRPHQNLPFMSQLWEEHRDIDKPVHNSKGMMLRGCTPITSSETCFITGASTIAECPHGCNLLSPPEVISDDSVDKYKHMVIHKTILVEGRPMTTIEQATTLDEEARLQLLHHRQPFVRVSVMAPVYFRTVPNGSITAPVDISPSIPMNTFMKLPRSIKGLPPATHTNTDTTSSSTIAATTSSQSKYVHSHCTDPYRTAMTDGFRSAMGITMIDKSPPPPPTPIATSSMYHPSLPVKPFGDTRFTNSGDTLTPLAHTLKRKHDVQPKPRSGILKCTSVEERYDQHRYTCPQKGCCITLGCSFHCGSKTRTHTTDKRRRRC